jgi:hypothetical protein
MNKAPLPTAFSAPYRISDLGVLVAFLDLTQAAIVIVIFNIIHLEILKS